MTSIDHHEHPFADLASFMALPRLSGLALSNDGMRLVTVVAAGRVQTKGEARDFWCVGGRAEREWASELMCRAMR